MSFRGSLLPGRRYAFGCGAVVVGALLAMAVATSPMAAQDRSRPPVKRARPPKFDAVKTAEYFFDDVFTKLIGERPQPATAVAGPVGSLPVAGGAVPGGNAPAATPASGAGWSKIVSAATLEDEVKAIKQEVDKSVTTPSDFAGRGHKVARREFSILAMLFAIVSEYDGDVRFKRDASVARAAFARSASNTKAGGNTNVFNEAKQRKADLEDLLSGSSLVAASGQQASNWGTTIDRPPLMQRLEAAQQNRLSPALANKDEFSKNSPAVLHEAEMIAAMATVLAKEGMNDADDETYTGFAKSMKDVAVEIAQAVKLKNYDQARTASGKIEKACSQCHENYR